MFIVVTGLDGSGTSTIAEKLSRLDEGSIVLKTPSPEYRDRDVIDNLVRKHSPVGHFLYYLSSTVFMSDYIKANFDYREKNVYCVRYLVDTYVSNKVAGLPIEYGYNVLGNELLQPDLTIFVGIQEQVREKRITGRGKSELDKVLDDKRKREAFLSEFDAVLDKDKTYYLDNTGDCVDETVGKLYEFIKTYKK